MTDQNKKLFNLRIFIAQIIEAIHSEKAQERLLKDWQQKLQRSFDAEQKEQHGHINAGAQSSLPHSAEKLLSAAALTDLTATLVPLITALDRTAKEFIEKAVDCIQKNFQGQPAATTAAMQQVVSSSYQQMATLLPTAAQQAMTNNAAVATNPATAANSQNVSSQNWHV